MFLNLGFSNAWWNKLYSLDFSEYIYMDPLEKVRCQDFMDSVIRERFGRFGFLDNLNETAVLSQPSVAVEPYGHRFIPAMFGSPVRYCYNQAPWAETFMLDKDYIMTLEPLTKEQFTAHPLVREIVRQCNILKVRGRKCSAQQNLGSVMNTAIYLRGMELFLDFEDNPEMVHKLFSLITSMMLTSYDYFCGIDGKQSSLGVGNCTVTMLSPQIYEQFVRPYDIAVMDHAKSHGIPFMVHQDSNVDPFVKSYKSFYYLNSFDIGCDTNITRFRSEFPDIKINVFIYTSVLHEKNERELFDYIVGIAVKGGSLDRIGFSVFDIDDNVPMERVESLCKAYMFLKAIK